VSDASEWTTVTLAEVADIRFSNVDKKSLAGEKSVRLCNYMDVYSNNYITADLPFMEATATAPEMDRFRVEKGDNMITKDSETPDDIGIPAVVIDDIPNLICGYHLALIRPKRDKIDPAYLSKQLGSNQSAKYFSRLANGSTRYGLSSSAIASIKIPLAPLVEQCRLADVLSTLDKAIEKTETLIAKYQQIKSGLMHDLFTRGVTSDGKLRLPREQAPELYQATPIGWIPKEWDCRKLGKILHESGGYLQTGPFGSQLHAHEYTHDGIPVVMPQDIEDGKIFTNTIARIPESRSKFLARHRVKLGDIIIARRGELSRAAAISQREIGWVCGTGCFLLRLSSSKLDPYFFSCAYRHDIIQRQIEGLAVGSTMPSLNNSVMRSLYFPYLTENEQHRISDRLETQDKTLLSLNTENEKLEKQKAGLMHDLLTGRVRVKVT